MGEAIRACHNMILAHYRAVKIFKDLGCTGKIGAVIHMEPIYAWTLDPKDREAADRRMAFYTGWWLDPMLKGHYPEILRDYSYIMDMLPEGYQKDLDEHFIPNDYIGINYYSPGYARYVDDGKLCYDAVSNHALPKDDYGFRFYPEGLFDMGIYLQETYPGKDIFITENGFGKKKWGNLEEELDDSYRVDMMREHLRSMSRAIRAGVPYKGYFHWTIMDTNELYAGGYNFMFGMIQIDYETLERRPRKSWYYYQNVIRQGAVE
jgi:beta-glucosidase